ncbi:MAG: ATP synthase F1 subunit delta [Candidatus Latescibacteria bacterium]|nr:ATP synthase F1 subunit delta [Candidatus Latescibacterota bacterium]
MTKNKLVAKRYAKAFLNEKLDKEAFDAMTEEIGSLVGVIQKDETVHEFFVSPVNSKEIKLRIIRNLVEKMHFSGYTLSLFEVLIRKNRIGILASVLEELQEISDQKHNRIRLKVTTAVEPSVSDLKEMKEKISTFFDRELLVERQIDPAIIGGFTIEGDGKLIDLSILGQIERALSDV